MFVLDIMYTLTIQYMYLYVLYVLYLNYIRRERNRMHAKKTRDKKKNVLEINEKLIEEMEKESRALRAYLYKLNLVSDDEIRSSKLRENQSKLQLDHFKV